MAQYGQTSFSVRGHICRRVPCCTRSCFTQHAWLALVKDSRRMHPFGVPLGAAVTAGLPIFVIAKHGTGLWRGDADETEHRFIAWSTSIRRLFPIARRTAAAWADSLPVLVSSSHRCRCPIDVSPSSLQVQHLRRRAARWTMHPLRSILSDIRCGLLNRATGAKAVSITALRGAVPPARD